MEIVAERFVKAVEALATGLGSIQERVDSAWTELIPLKQDDFPPELQPYFEVVEAEMLRSDDPSHMEDNSAVASAGRIFQLALLAWRVSEPST